MPYGQEVRGILAQAASVGAGDLDLYTVAGTIGRTKNDTHLGQLWICEAAGAPTNIRVHIIPDGGAATIANAIIFDHPLAAFEHLPPLDFTAMRLPPGGKVVVRSSAGADTAGFTLTGTEYYLGS